MISVCWEDDGLFAERQLEIAWVRDAVANSWEAVSAIRFVGWLQPGQSALISAGAFGTAAEADTLELVHKGDRLSATAVTKVAAVQ